MGSWVFRSMLALATVSSSGCLQFGYTPYGGERVAGHFESQGGELGDFTLELDRCTRRPDGNSYDFSGASAERIVRLASESVQDDPNDQGTRRIRFVARVANVGAPGGPRELVFERGEACEVWSGYAHFGNRDGAVQIDCRTPEGGRVKGYLTFVGCM
jgi:hypothetical protein